MILSLISFALGECKIARILCFPSFSFDFMGLEDSGTRNFYLQIVFESNLFAFYMVFVVVVVVFVFDGGTF